LGGDVVEDCVDGVLDPILEWFREIEEHVPGILGRVLRFLVDIPQGSETGMFHLADAYGNAASELSTYLENISSLNDPIAESWGGDGAVAFQEYWAGYIDQVSNSIASMIEMQGIIQDVGLEIEMAKFMAAMNLYMLADAIFTILSTAAITFGLSTVAAPAAEAACQAGIKSAGRTLLEKILGQKFSGLIGDFAKYLGDKALPTALKDGGKTLLKDGGENLLKDGGESLAKDAAGDLAKDAGSTLAKDAAGDLAKDAGSTLAKDAAGDLAKDAAGDVAKDAAGDLAADAAADAARAAAADAAGTSVRTAATDVARSAGGKLADAGKFVAERLSLRGIGARGLANKAAAAFAKDQLESGLLKTLGSIGKDGLFKTVGEGLANKSATAVVREAAYQSALADLRNQGLGDVLKVVGKDALQSSWNGARGFVAFQLKTTLGFTALQWAEGHNPQLDLVQLGEGSLQNAAIGAFGGPLTAALGHGVIGSVASMTGGTAAVDGIKTAMGQKVDWATDMKSSVYFGAMAGSQHGFGELSGHVIDRGVERVAGRDAAARVRDGVETRDPIGHDSRSESTSEVDAPPGPDRTEPVVHLPGTDPAATHDTGVRIPEPRTPEPQTHELRTAEPQTSGPEHTEPATTAPRGTEPHQTEPPRSEPPRTEQRTDRPDVATHTTDPRGSDGRPDQQPAERQAEPHQTEPHRTESRQTEPPRTDPDPGSGHRDADQVAHSRPDRVADASHPGTPESHPAADPAIHRSEDPAAEVPEVRADDVNLPATRLDDAVPTAPTPAHTAEPGAEPTNPVEARQHADHEAHLADAPASAVPDATVLDTTRAEAEVGTDSEISNPVPPIDFTVEAHLGPSTNLDPARTRYATDLPRDVHDLVDRARTRLLEHYPPEVVAERIDALNRIDGLAHDLERQAADARRSGDLHELISGVRSFSRAIGDYSSAYDQWRDFSNGGRPADPGWRDLDGVDPLNSTEMAHRAVSVDPALQHLDVMDRAIALAKIGDVLGPEFERHAATVLERAIPRTMDAAQHRLDPQTARDLSDAINNQYAKGVYDAKAGVTLVDTVDRGNPRSVSAVAATIVHESMHVLQPNLHLLRSRMMDSLAGHPDADARMTDIGARMMFEREYQAFTVQQHFLRGLAGFRDRLDDSHHQQIPATDRYRELADETPQQIRDRVIRDYLEDRPQFGNRTGTEILGEDITAPDFLERNPELTPEHIIASARTAIVDAYPEHGAGTPGGLVGPETGRIAGEHGVDLDTVRTDQRDVRFPEVHNDAPTELELTGAGHNVIHAAAVPADPGFSGEGPATPDAAHRVAVLNEAQSAMGRILDGHGGAELVREDNHTYEIKLADGGSFSVRVDTQWRDPDAAAESHLNHDTGRHVIQISDRLAIRHVERAVAHEIGEIIADRARYLAGEPAYPPDALAPGELPAGARLSPHDAGRIQELRVIGERLGSLPPDGHRDEVQQQEFEALRTSSLALADHLGVRAGEPGWQTRRDLITEHVADAGPAARDAIERTLALGGRSAADMHPDEIREWRDVQDRAAHDMARIEQFHRALEPRFERPDPFGGADVPPGTRIGGHQLTAVADAARESREARSAETLADLRARAAGLPPGEYVHVSLHAGGGASLAARDLRSLLVDNRGRWPSDNGTEIAQTADQLRNLRRTGLGDPFQFAAPGERVPLDAISYMEDTVAAQGPLVNGTVSLRLDSNGVLVADIRPDDGSAIVTVAVDGVPVLSTGFPQEIIVGVDRGLGMSGTFGAVSAHLAADGTPSALRAKTAIDALPWGDEATGAKVAEILRDHGINPHDLTDGVRSSLDAIIKWHDLRVTYPGRVLSGDEANTLGKADETVTTWVVGGVGGTAISAVENMINRIGDAHIVMTGDRAPDGLDNNTQWKMVRRDFDPGYDAENPGAESAPGAVNSDAVGDHLQLVLGVRVVDVSVTVTSTGPEFTLHAADGRTFTGGGVVTSLGGRNAVPPPLADMADAVLRADPHSVSGRMLFDSGGQYLGYRLTIAGHDFDVTGAASRFYPGRGIFGNPSGRVFGRPDEWVGHDGLYSTTEPRFVAARPATPAQSSSQRDAPAESGNFDGGFVASAVQASRYAAFISWLDDK
jgi:hypothetical protein